MGAGRRRSWHQRTRHAHAGVRHAAREAGRQAAEFAVARTGRSVAVAASRIGADGCEGVALFEPGRGSDVAATRLHPARTHWARALPGVGSRVILGRVRAKKVVGSE